jgi:hypothetical protein
VTEDRRDRPSRGWLDASAAPPQRSGHPEWPPSGDSSAADDAPTDVYAALSDLAPHDAGLGEPVPRDFAPPQGSWMSEPDVGASRVRLTPAVDPADFSGRDGSEPPGTYGDQPALPPAGPAEMYGRPRAAFLGDEPSAYVRPPAEDPAPTYGRPPAEDPAQTYGRLGVEPQDMYADPAEQYGRHSDDAVELYGRPPADPAQTYSRGVDPAEAYGRGMDPAEMYGRDGAAAEAYGPGEGPADMYGGGADPAEAYDRGGGLAEAYGRGGDLTEMYRRPASGAGSDSTEMFDRPPAGMYQDAPRVEWVAADQTVVGDGSVIDLSVPRPAPVTHRGRNRRRRTVVAVAALGAVLAGGTGYAALRGLGLDGGTTHKDAQLPLVTLQPTTDPALPDDSPSISLPASASVTAQKSASPSASASASSPAVPTTTPSKTSGSTGVVVIPTPAPTVTESPHVVKPVPPSNSVGATAAPLAARFSQVSNGSGLVGTVTVTNPGAAAVDDWTVSITVPGAGAVAVNGASVRQNGDGLTFSGSSIAAGGSLGFTFTVSGPLSGSATGCTVNGNACS